MKHIVFLVSEYYPKFSAVSKCIGNLADEFVNEYKVTVIAMKGETNIKDFIINNNQQIYRITTKRLNKLYKINNSIKTSRGIKNKIYKVNKFLFRLSSYFKVLFSKNTLNNELSNMYLKKLEELNERIDYVIPACSPFAAVYAASRYVGTHENTKMFPILFDFFAENRTLNKFALNRIIKRKNNLSLENKCFSLSSKIFCLNNWKDHINKYHSEFAGKIVEIEHPLIKLNNEILNLEERENNTKNQLCFAGSLIKKYVDPKYILKIFSDPKFSKYKISFYSSGTGCKIFSKYSNVSHIKLNGWVSLDELKLIYSESLALINIAEVKGSQLSSKIFEYISYNKPIIHFYFTKNDVNLKYLNKYPYCLCIYVTKNNIDEIKVQILDFLERIQELQEVNIKSTIKDFLEFTPAYVMNIIRKNLINVDN